MTYFALTAAIAFAFGFLLGDRRGVRQANQILGENNRVLIQAIGDSVRSPVEGEDEHRPVLH